MHRSAQHPHQPRFNHRLGAVSSPIENTTMSPINPQATSNVPLAESKCKNIRVLTTPYIASHHRLLSTDHQLESERTAMLSAPLQSRRGDDVSISSYLHLQCTTSLRTTIQWTITHCSSQPCSTVPIQLPQSLQSTASTGELFIPACTLDYGTYRLQDHRLHGCSTSADLGGLDLRADHSILHHPKPHALRHIDDCPWTEPRPPAQSRHLLRRSRCSHIRS